MISIELIAGTHIEMAAKSLCEIADKADEDVTASFNGYEIEVSPLTDPSDVVKNYNAFCYHERERYQKSPEGIAAKEKQEAEYQAALSAPPKMFSVRTVLTVTTKMLLTIPKNSRDNGIDDLYQIIDHALATSVSTIEIPSAGDVLRPKILEQYPELKIASQNLELLDSLLEKEDPQIAIEAWVESLNLAPEYEIPVYKGK